jgi:hypothetical protein
MSRSKLTPLGHARVFRHPSTGELVVDTDSLRRSDFSGEFAGDDDDDFGDDDDDFGDDDDDFGDDDDDFGDDDDDFGDDDDDFGRRGRGRARRKARRTRRKARRKTRRARRGGEDSQPQKKGKWGMTAVGGTDTLSEAGAASVKIRLQHDFKAQDVTFTGSADGSKVTSIFFGDRVVWSNSDGIDVGVFASNSFLRGLLKGQSLRAGLDITVNGNLGGAGSFSATLIGQKPVGR